MNNSPFKFLDSYTKDDLDIFFGREKETEELYSRVFESRVVLIYGTSGTGKSSLINCGLANKFNETDWLPVTVRRGTNINRSLAESLGRQLITGKVTEPGAQGSERGVDMVKLISDVYLDHFRPVYLIFDQFEELFIFGSNEEKNELITGVKKVIDSDLQCRFIFSIREEYLAGVTEFEKVIPTFLSNRMRIERMTRVNARRVVEGPCRFNNIKVEEGFAESLLEKLNPESSGVELTWLQVYLDRVFRVAGEGSGSVNEITKDDLRNAGEVKDLLGSFLEEQISQLDDPDTGMVILKSFVSVRGTRQQITEDNVIEYSKILGRDTGREKVKELVRRFINLRILREKDENGRYELRHDSLAAKIYEKITLVEKELLEIRQFLENALSNHEKRGTFLTAEDLKYIAPYEERLFLNEKTSRLIAHSKWSLQKAKRRRQRILVSAVLIIVGILSFFTLWALNERDNAREQEDIAVEQKIKAQENEADALLSKQKEEIAKEIAERNLKLADSSEKIARYNEALAKKQSEEAIFQKANAERNEKEARKQEEIARSEAKRAEAEKMEALRLRKLSIGKALAIKSLQYQGQKDLQALLAYHAFIFNRNNGGNPADADIYLGLYNTVKQYGSLNYKVFTGHDGGINSIAFIPGRREFFTSGFDGKLIRWRSEGKNNSPEIISKDPEIIEVLAMSHDGKWLACGGLNAAIKVLPVDGNPDSAFELKGHNKQVNSLQFSTDGRYLWSAAADGRILKWRLEDKSPGEIMTDGIGVIYAEQTNDGRLFAGITADGRAVVWNTEDPGERMIIESRNRRVRALKFSYRGDILAVGYSDGYIEIRSMPGNKVTDEFYAHSSTINAICFSSNSRMATASNDQTVKLWNTDDLALPPVVLKENNSFAITAEFSHDGQFIVTGNWESPNNLTGHATLSESLAGEVLDMITRNLTQKEWADFIGIDIEYEKIIGN